MENPFQKVIEGAYLATVKYAPSLPESLKWFMAMKTATEALEMCMNDGMTEPEAITLLCLQNMQKAHDKMDKLGL